MTCPFLGETRVRYCQASPMRKMLTAGQGDPASERCSNASHTGCALYASRAPAGAEGPNCPYLHDGLVHYCSAAPVLKFIPFSDQAGRCGSSGYRFCDLYLAFERAGENASVPRAGSTRVPAGLFYTANHLWLHVGPNGTCHVGIDEFFASVLHAISGVSFVTTTGVDRPSAVLKVQGVDWPVSFPNRLLITTAHLYLRSNPTPLIDDPYGAGWLFEGCELPGSPATEGLMAGPQALSWMQLERTRLDEAIHDMTGVRHGAGPALMNDGGAAVAGVLGQLDREEILRMFHAFFAPGRAWGEEFKR